MRPRSLIAVLSTYYRPVVGGVETAAERLARFLARRGHRVMVLTKRTSTADPTTEMLDDVEIRRTPPVGLRRAAGKWLAIPAFLLELWQRRAVLRAIICVDYRGIGLAALLAGLLAGIPVVFETSTDGTISGEAVRRRVVRLGGSHDGPVARALTWPIRATYGRADLFICVSHTIERELLDNGVPSTRIHYLPHTVDTSRFRPVTDAERRTLRETLHLPRDGPIVVFVGRLSREKGILDLIDAWWRTDVRGAHLVVVGPDMPGHPWDAGPAARALVSHRGLDSSVTFAGPVRPEDVPRWLQAADVAVQPSHFEAFGIAAAEAMSVGLPVVVSDVGGFRDYVVDEVNGFRVPPRSPEALRDALTILLTDAPLRRQLGRAAAATARRFDEQLVLEEFTRVLERMAMRT